MSGKQRNIRKRRALDEQEELPDGPDAAEGEGGAPRLTAEDIRLLQKQRQRHGVRAGCRPLGGSSWCLHLPAFVHFSAQQWACLLERAAFQPSLALP